jgi:hypothetical protein
VQHMYMDGVVYHRISGSAQPMAPMDLATRRGDPSAVVRHFVSLVRQAAKDFCDDESLDGRCGARKRKSPAVAG